MCQRRRGALDCGRVDQASPRKRARRDHGDENDCGCLVSAEGVAQLHMLLTKEEPTIKTTKNTTPPQPAGTKCGGCSECKNTTVPEEPTIKRTKNTTVPEEPETTKNTIPTTTEEPATQINEDAFPHIDEDTLWAGLLELA